MTDYHALDIKSHPCRSAAARLASNMTLHGAYMDELGQVGASLRHCYGNGDCGPDNGNTDNGNTGQAGSGSSDDIFQDLLAQLR